MKEKKINLITVAIIVSEILPYLLCSVLVLVTRESVNWFLNGLIQVLGILSLLLIGNIGLKKIGIEKKEEREYICSFIMHFAYYTNFLLERTYVIQIENIKRDKFDAIFRQ